MKTEFTRSLCLLAALVIALVLGCGPAAPSAQVNEGLASPQIVAGPSTPRFLSGDTAQADAGPNDWVLIDQKQNDNHYLVQDYVKKGQTGTTWDSLVTYLNTVRPDESIMDFMNRQKGIMEKKCPGAGWQILSRSENQTVYGSKVVSRPEIVYESRVASCPGIGDQDEIVRVIYGEANMFRISYTSKVKEMPSAQRGDALKLLSEFQVQKKS
jgi:hypothetical protein